MALKGTTRIELTNVKTGEQEVIEKTNLVTNAVSDIFSKAPFGTLLYNSKYDIMTNLHPIAKKAIGGILLYADTHEERPEKYFADGTIPVTGYANCETNDTTDIKRGSLNLTESGNVDGGYRFVWDFTTSQANGTIASLGLTSNDGGVANFGSWQDRARCMRFIQYTSGNGVYTITGEASRLFRGAVYLDEETGYLYGAEISGQKQITVSKAKLRLFEMGVIYNMNAGAPYYASTLETEILEPKTFGDSAAERRYYAMLYGEDGYIWGFEHANNANGNSSGNATIHWIKISIEDWSFEEGTWTIPLQLKGFGSKTVATLTSPDYEPLLYSIIANGYLHCISYNGKTFYKININNPTDIITFPLKSWSGLISGNTSENNHNWTIYNYTYFNKVGNTVYCANGYFEADKFIEAKCDFNGKTTTEGPYGLKGHCTPGLHVGPYLIGFRATYYQYNTNTNFIDKMVWLPMNYLATINNLPTPVEKTADKTMKITYILREES